MIIDRKRTLKGFTLLELLVVISIIGILVALGAVAFSTAQKKGRDAKRQGDMKAVQNAFEQYYAQNSQYANNCDTMWSASQSTGARPDDPVPTLNYFYNCASTTTYTVCADMDDASLGNFSDSAGTAAGVGYYCVKNLQ